MKLIIDDFTIVEATPELIADAFAEMDSEHQARFFNRIAEVASTWQATFPFQLQYITEEDGLNLAGRRVMQQIGDYSHWGIVCQLNSTR